MTTTDRVVVLGAGSLVADHLLPRLATQAGAVDIVSRHHQSFPPGIAAVPFDALASGGWRCPPGATVVSLQPLETLIPLLPRLVEADAIVALGSTRRFSNLASSNPVERTAAEALVTAEADLDLWGRAAGVATTLLRPTLIYDVRRDQNIVRMAAFIRRFGVLPLARPANGLRQPIHGADVAAAILGALGNPAARDRAFTIAGGERLAYKAMAARVFASLGRRPRFVSLPLGLLAGGLSLAGRVGLVRNPAASLSVFQRMNEDLVFDVDEGLRVLGYAPRMFDPTLPA